MYVVCCLLCVVGCVLCAGVRCVLLCCCSLHVVCWRLRLVAVRCWLSVAVACCGLAGVSRVMCVVCCVLCVGRCSLVVVCCVLLRVACWFLCVLFVVVVVCWLVSDV